MTAIDKTVIIIAAITVAVSPFVGLFYPYGLAGFAARFVFSL